MHSLLWYWGQIEVVWYSGCLSIREKDAKPKRLKGSFSCFVFLENIMLNQLSSPERYVHQAGKIHRHACTLWAWLPLIKLEKKKKKRTVPLSSYLQAATQISQQGNGARLSSWVQIWFQACAAGLQSCVESLVPQRLPDHLNSTMSAYIQNDLLRLMCSASCPEKLATASTALKLTCDLASQVRNGLCKKCCWPVTSVSVLCQGSLGDQENLEYHRLLRPELGLPLLLGSDRQKVHPGTKI